MSGLMKMNQLINILLGLSGQLTANSFFTRCLIVDRIISNCFLLILNTGKNKLIYEEKQQTWVEFFEDIFMLEDLSGFILRSDKDKFHHIFILRS
jgi:hypothetical protein